MVFKIFKKKDGSINRKFIDLYIKELNKISSEDFLNRFKEKYLDKVEFYNTQFFSEKSNKDRTIFKGLGYFIFDKNYLDNRKIILKRLADINSDKFVKLTLEDNKIKFYSKIEWNLKKMISICRNENTFLNFIFPDGNINFDQIVNIF